MISTFDHPYKVQVYRIKPKQKRFKRWAIYCPLCKLRFKTRKVKSQQAIRIAFEHAYGKKHIHRLKILTKEMLGV